MDLGALRNEEQKIWLNVASSRQVLPGFVNFDNSPFLRLLRLAPLVRPMLNSGHRAQLDAFREARKRAILIRHDCRKRLPLPDACADHVLCSHFLEHVHFEEMQVILGDLHRVLRPGGTLHVVVPDLAILIDRYLEKKREGEAAESDAANELVHETFLTRESRGSLRFRLLEFLGGYGLNHRWMYDEASMRARIREAGFEILENSETPSRDYRRDDGISLHLVGARC